MNRQKHFWGLKDVENAMMKTERVGLCVEVKQNSDVSVRYVA